ncbi:Required for respiratory growth protein 9 mitochondrial [Mortierella claussenii]|nr:Required for respiratory growth protein 9 mitochondrial [Mortierella claussenii]
MQEASDRWGLGASEYAPIVFPKGRDEIKKKIMDRASTRRSIGYPDRGRISEVEKSTHRHLGDRSSSGGTAKTSTTASSVATKTISLDLRSASSPNPHLHQMSRESSEEKPVPLWMKHQMAIKEKLNGQAWSPQKRVTRKAMDEIRFLHKQFPEEWTTPKLAKHFNIASESVRRILKSNFQISPERAAEQDQIKERIRKEKVKAAVERLAARRHENWKKRQEERQQIRKTATEKERGVIRLGAPKRFFGSS